MIYAFVGLVFSRTMHSKLEYISTETHMLSLINIIKYIWRCKYKQVFVEHVLNHGVHFMALWVAYKKGPFYIINVKGCY